MVVVLTQGSPAGSQPAPVFPLPLRFYGGLNQIEQAIEDGVVDRETGERLCARIRALMVGRA